MSSGLRYRTLGSPTTPGTEEPQEFAPSDLGQTAFLRFWGAAEAYGRMGVSAYGRVGVWACRRVGVQVGEVDLVD